MLALDRTKEHPKWLEKMYEERSGALATLSRDKGFEILPSGAHYKLPS